MTDNVKLMFEVEDLRNASPATVSRAGVIYVSDSDLDWIALVDAWVLEFVSVYGSYIRQLFLDVIKGNGLAGDSASASSMGKQGA